MKAKRGERTNDLRAFLTGNPKASYEDYKRAYPKLPLTSSCFYKVRVELRGTAKSTKQDDTSKATADLIEENRYLRWLLTGERNGWLDRALHDMAMK